MIKFVKNGKFRRLSITINRLVDNVISIGDGFPITESILQSFSGFPIVSEEYFSAMNDVDFGLRTEGFKSYLLLKYPFLSVGDFANTAFGVDEILCVPEVIISESQIQITQDTNFILYFDATGSMNNTSDKLDAMRRGVLKDKLLQFYNNDQTLYDQKVRLLNFTSERGFTAANHMNLPINGNTLVILIQNEANSVYHGVPFSGIIKTPAFLADLALLKTRIIETRPYGWKVISLHVHGPGGWRSSSDAYKAFMQAIETGTTGYEIENSNLTNYPEFKFVYDLNEGATPEYYLDVILQSMRTMGYAI